MKGTDDREQRKLILVTNDDGYAAQGIGELAALMRGLGDVVVVAPDSARSGSGCSVAANVPVGLYNVSNEPGLRVVACTGTPVDCVKLALEEVCERVPDLVVSGINHGDNASISVHYSGTIGAVLEACMKGIPAIGYSLRTNKSRSDFTPYTDVILQVTRHVLEHSLPEGVCLNVNFPEVERLSGTRVARLARGAWRAEWAEAHHPRGGNYYWLTGYFRNLEPEAADTDCWALEHGYAAITPIQIDMTAYDSLSSLNALNSDQS